MDAMRGFLLAEGSPRPFYSYAIHAGHRRYASGSTQAVRDVACPYVILHRHALVYSQIDSVFAQDLAKSGQLLARFVPGDDATSARYDFIDAYYLPTGAFGGLKKTGPELEVWRVGPDRTGSWTSTPCTSSRCEGPPNAPLPVSK